MKLFPFFAILFLLFTQTVRPDSADSLLIKPGEIYIKDINSFGGRVEIEGEVKASIFMVGGSLKISGKVHEDVICINTRVNIDKAAQIQRDLIVILGKLDIVRPGSVEGKISYIQNMDDMKKMASSIFPLFPENGDWAIYKMMKITFWFVLCLILLAILQEKIIQAGALLKKNPASLMARGLGLYILFFISLIVSTVLSLFFIGIPLLIALLLIYFFALAFGRTVIFHEIGKTIAKALHFKLNSTYYVLLGFLPYVVLKFIPGIGWILIIIMDLLVLGISFCFFRQRFASRPVK